MNKPTKIKFRIRENISLISLLIIMIVVTWNHLNMRIWEDNNRVIAWDVIDYYGYLPATFIYKDLTLRFTEENYEYFRNKIWSRKLPDGNRVFKMTSGLSVMYFPFFISAHVIAKLTGIPATGFSNPYRIALLISSIAYLFIGFLALKYTLKRYFSDLIVAITVLGLYFGTNLFYYTTIEAPMSHVYGFCLFALFILLTLKWYEHPTWKYSILLGLASGLIVLVRPSNMVIVVFFIVYGTIFFMKNNFSINHIFKIHGKHLIVIIVFAFLTWVPQLIYWKKITGSFMYYSYNDEGFFFTDPKILKGLFSFRKGWLIYTPIMSFALAGIIILYKRINSLFLPILIFTIVNLYIIFSWWTWWYGGGFSQRPLIESYALLAIPLAASIEKVISKGKAIRIPLIFVFILFFLLGIWNHIKYYYGSIHWDGMTKEAYFDHFFETKPRGNYWEQIERPDYEKAKEGQR